VTGILGGLFCAIFWCGAGTCSATCARVWGPIQSLAMGCLIGSIAIPLVALVWVGVPHAPLSDWLWAVGYGVGTMLALTCIFRAYSMAKVGLVSAIVSTNGTIAALVSVAVLGEELPPAAILATLIVGTGVCLAALREGDPATGPRGGSDRVGAVFALLGACGFAGAVLSGAQADTLDPIWVVAVGRLFGLVVVTVPVWLSGRLPKLDREILPYAIGSPMLDAAGFAALLIGSETGVAVPAVLSTLSAVFLALVGHLVFRERMSRLQWAGALTTLAGVATLAATR
jgi:drug/metabolite transporter (DMT)-like permease